MRTIITRDFVVQIALFVFESDMLFFVSYLLCYFLDGIACSNNTQ
jgi:hypothetical protein